MNACVRVYFKVFESENSAYLCLFTVHIFHAHGFNNTIFLTPPPFFFLFSFPQIRSIGLRLKVLKGTRTLRNMVGEKMNAFNFFDFASLSLPLFLFRPFSACLN